MQAYMLAHTCTHVHTHMQAFMQACTHKSKAWAAGRYLDGKKVYCKDGFYNLVVQSAVPNSKWYLSSLSKPKAVRFYHTKDTHISSHTFSPRLGLHVLAFLQVQGLGLCLFIMFKEICYLWTAAWVLCTWSTFIGRYFGRGSNIWVAWFVGHLTDFTQLTLIFGEGF